MPRGCLVCLLVVCVVLMDGAAQTHAQQAISLRPSLDTLSNAEREERDAAETTGEQTAEDPDGQRAEVVEDTQPANRTPLDEAYADSALIPPPPPGGIPPRVGAQPPADSTRRPAAAPELGPYEPLGLRMGGFLAYPTLEVTGVVSDNVRLTDTQREADVGLRVSPELRLQSNWVRHSYSLTGTGEFIFYADNTDFDETTASVTSDLLLDVRHTTTLGAVATYNMTQTAPASSEVPDAATGKRTDHDMGFAMTLTQRMGRLIGEIGAGVRYVLFDDVTLSGGGVENNSDRNYLEPSARLRLSYEQTPAVRPFAEVSYRPRIHDQRIDRSGLRRDSHGGTVSAGVEFDLSEIWAGEVALRYDVRDFEDSNLETVHSGGIDANVTWRPSRLTTVRLNATSDLAETASANVSAIRRYNGALDVDHALRENVILSANVGLAFSDRIGSRQDELEFDAGVGMSYIIARQIELIARYGFTQFETFRSDSDYYENLFTAGVRFRL